MNQNHYEVYIGIDVGKHTGVAIWEPGVEKLTLHTLLIHQAMKLVAHTLSDCTTMGYPALVRVEDARKRSDASAKSWAKAQGAGSVKRDSTIWEDFLTDINASFEMVSPQRNHTKLSEEAFVSLTGYTKRCSGHARDAAMLVVLRGLTPTQERQNFIKSIKLKK